MDIREKIQRQKHPREKANILSRLSFAYTWSLFRKAIKHDIEEKDLYEVISSCSSKKCGNRLGKQWKLENQKSASPSVIKLIWALFGWRYVLIGCTKMIVNILKSILEPYAVSSLITYFKAGQTNITKNDAYFYAFLVLLLHIFDSVFVQNYTLWVQQLGIEIKVSFSSFLYRKSLKLTPTVISQITLGNVVTLINKDVNTFVDSIQMLNDLVIGLVQTAVICYLIYNKMGVTSLIGIAVILSILPIQGCFAKWISNLRLELGKKCDERLQIMQELLSSIKIVKMYTWETYFSEKINNVRKKELSKMLLGFFLSMSTLLTGILFVKIGFYVLISTNLWMGYPTDTTLVFYIFSNMNDLKRAIGILLSYNISMAARCYAAVTRIKILMNAEELCPEREYYSKPVIQLEKATVHIGNKDILRNITFKVDSGLTVITGRVGSGKTLLLKTILQEYPLKSGHLVSNNSISYASQDFWLFPSSIKQNIIFDQKFNENKYSEVIKVCALEYDFKLFAKGDETIVTDRGLNLSRGQQARINLARAIYRTSEIYLLDDPLADLDVKVQNYVFKECIETYLKDKICIFVCQAATFIQKADNVIFMDNGTIKTIGKPTERILKEIYDTPDKDIIIGTRNRIMTENREMEMNETDSLLPIEPVERENVYSEEKELGNVDLNVYIKYIKFGGGIIALFLVVLLTFLVQYTSTYDQGLLTQWIDDRQQFLDIQARIAEYKSNSSNSSVVDGLNALEKCSEEAEYQEQYTFMMYTILLMSSNMLLLVRCYAILEFCRRSSANLHKKMLHRVIHATMNFYDSHFIGNILNRFSQDLVNIDEYLPFVLDNFLRLVFLFIGQSWLIVSVNISFIIYPIIIVVSSFVLRMLYLPAGRSLKRLESATRSPIIGHLNASLEGLTTIRACKAENILSDEFDRHQDLYTSAFYTSTCSMKAFGFVIHSLCSTCIILVVASLIFMDKGRQYIDLKKMLNGLVIDASLPSAVFNGILFSTASSMIPMDICPQRSPILINKGISAGNVGLALIHVLLLGGTVQFGYEKWSEMETLMTSAERVLGYSKVNSETETGNVIENWPSEGAVTFQGVSLSYNSDVVLKHVSFNVEPNQKIGIVGRTGAGKSSLISSIFRLYDTDGIILIDGVDIKSLSLKFLRRQIAVIPQNSLLFSGTVRSNLDPFNEFSDYNLWAALERVNLRECINDLNKEVNSHGSNFSSGQRQLIYLARAILRKAKIIILDEATANMDNETDILLNNTIEENFEECTVFKISHRLESILECDKIMVLEKGEIREFGNTFTLLENEGGHFYKLVKQAGLLNYLN